MKNISTPKLVALLRKKVTTFRTVGEFRPADLKRVFEDEGLDLDWSFLKMAVKVRRGVYFYKNHQDGNAVPAENVPESQKVSKDQPQPETVDFVSETVKREGLIKDNEYSYVPTVDRDYVPFGEYKDIETIVKSGIFYPVLITGHSGNGKTMSVEQACARAKRPMLRINCTKRTDEDVLIGSKTLIDGNVVVKEGPILIAMRSGAVVLMDEFSCADPSSIMCIQGIMEGKAYYFHLTGEYIQPAHGFNIIMTDNTKGQGSDDGRYVGTNVLNEAFLERIGTVFEQEFPSQAVEKRIVLKRMETKGCVNDAFAEDLVKWAAAIRKTFDDGGIDSCISTRRLGHIVDNYSIFRNRNKAVTLCTNRFPDMTKSAFVGLWKNVSTEVAAEAVAPEVEAPAADSIPF